MSNGTLASQELQAVLSARAELREETIRLAHHRPVWSERIPYLRERLRLAELELERAKERDLRG